MKRDLPVFGVALIMLGVAGAALLGFKNTHAESVDYNVNIAPSLNVDVSSSSVVLDLNPNSKTFGYEDLDVTVSTNYEAGYTLSMSTADNSTDLKRDASSDSVNASINTLGSSYTDANFSNCADTDTNCMNKWGYKNGLASTSYLPFASPVSPILSNTTATNGDTTTLRFAAKINYNQPAGTYNNELIFTATANPIIYDIKYWDLTGISSTDTSKYNDAGLTWSNPASGTAKEATYATVATQASSSSTASTIVLNPTYISGSASTRHTYTFAGWCLGSVNNTVVATQNSSNKVTAYDNPGTRCNGTVYQVGDNIQLDPSATNNLNFYALWTPTSFAEAGVAANSNMQTMTTAKCAATTPNQFTTMTDSRDSGANTYTIIKLMDGKCWMADNLNFDAYTYKNNITASNTHADGTVGSTAITRFKTTTATTTDRYATSAINSNTTYASSGNWTASSSYSDPLINNSGKCDPSKNSSYQCLSPYQNATYTTTKVIDKYGTPASDSSGTANITYNFGPGDYKIGTYYNYCTASLGSYCYGSGTSAGTSATGNATEADICPAGWKLPTGGASGNFQSLYTKISNITTTPNGATGLLSLQTMLSTPVSGTYDGGTAYRQGTYGTFWSSTFNSTSYMYSMSVSGTAVTPQNSNSRNDGRSVRCIAQ